MRSAIPNTSRAYRSKRRFREFESFEPRRAITFSSLGHGATGVSDGLTERARLLPQMMGKKSARPCRGAFTFASQFRDESKVRAAKESSQQRLQNDPALPSQDTTAQT